MIKKKDNEMFGKHQGCAPCPAEKQAAPPREKQALPRPAPQNLRNPRGAAGQNWLQIPLIPLFMTPTKDALKDERVGKSFHFTLFSDNVLIH